MRKLIILILIMQCVAAVGQQYDNEWIDFSKTYYKFKVADTGIYRISQATLSATGLGNTPAQQFKLFRNGKEVALSVSNSSGPLTANGYIEFWGSPMMVNLTKPSIVTRPISILTE